MDARSGTAAVGGASTPDAELLAAVARRDREAFHQFYERWAGRLLAYVKGMGAKGPQAEDLVQEVFVAVWQKAEQFRPQLGSAEAWIFTVTRHKVVDIWRRSAPVVDIEPGHLEALAGDGMDGHSASELALSLGKALASLAPEQRRPLQLAYFGDHSYEETAALLGLPVGTLKSRIRAGLGQMRSLLGGAP